MPDSTLELESSTNASFALTTQNTGGFVMPLVTSTRPFPVAAYVVPFRLWLLIEPLLFCHKVPAVKLPAPFGVNVPIATFDVEGAPTFSDEK